MANTKVVEVEVIEEEQDAAKMLRDNAHKMLQAGFGMVGMSQDRLATVQEDFNEFFNKLVERGEAIEVDGRKFFDELIERRKEQIENVADKADIDGRIEAVLNRMNLPSKDDIDTLTKKINALSRKIDQLKKES